MNQRILNNLREIPAMGNIYYVFPTGETYDDEFQALVDQTYSDGTQAFHTTIASAIAACTSGRNDVILLDANSTHSLSAGIALTANRINFIGMDGGGRLQQQGAKIQLATAATTAYVMKNTGVRNSFRNIKFIQAATAGTGLNVFQDGGEGSLFMNCSFAFGVADNLGGTTAHEFLAGSDSATFIDCTFGNDTLLTSGARSVFHIDQVTSGQEFKSNMFRGCNFMISSSSGTATFIRLDAITDILFSNTFRDCDFIASIDTAGGAAIAEAVQTGTGTNKGTLNFSNCGFFNCTKVTTATGGRNAGVQVVGPVPTALSSIGILPAAA